jgi:two-component system sensor histidine kinase KdpD
MPPSGLETWRMESLNQAAFTLPKPSRWRAAPTLGGVLAAIGLVGLTVAIGISLRGELPASSVPLIFLLAVLVASAKFGFWTGIFASLLAFLADNFFFIEPYFTFHVSQTSDWLTLVVLLVAGATTGFLVGRLREEADAASARAHSLAVMGQFVANVSQMRDGPAVSKFLVHALAQLNNGSALVLQSDNGRLKQTAAFPEDGTLSNDDQQAAERAMRRKGIEAPAAPGWTRGRFTFRPLGDAFGVVGYTDDLSFRPEFCYAREAVIDQAILAFQNLALAREANEAHGNAQREALRAALLSSLSHDLRTPLSTILGGISSLRELGDAMPSTARDDTLMAVEEEAERLSRYVGNLLHMTRLKAGIDLRLEWVDPADIVQGAVARARRAAANRSIAFTRPDQVPLVHSDAVLLEQALFNLIENALKFSPPSSQVSVSLTIEADGIVFAVSDSGPGIPPDEQAHIFEAFFRGSNRRESGSGLGLAISRGIVQALAGSISLESPIQNGHGTCMRISIRFTQGEACRQGK